MVCYNFITYHFVYSMGQRDSHRERSCDQILSGCQKVMEGLRNVSEIGCADDTESDV